VDRSLPILWKCQGLVVAAEGEGVAFARRLFTLVEAGAKVTLFSKQEPSLEIAMLVAKRKILRKRRIMQKSDVLMANLLLLAITDKTRIRRLSSWARNAKCRLACLTFPSLGDLQFAASVRWGDLLGAFWDRKKGSERLAFLRRRLKRTLPRWQEQARRDRAKPKRRLIRGWIS